MVGGTVRTLEAAGDGLIDALALKELLSEIREALVWDDIDAQRRSAENALSALEDLIAEMEQEIQEWRSKGKMPA